MKMIHGSVIRYLNRRSPRNIITINSNSSSFLTNGDCCKNLTRMSSSEKSSSSDCKMGFPTREITQYKLNIMVIRNCSENQILKSLKTLVDQTKFVVYSVEEDTIGVTTSWMAGCRALLIPGQLTNQVAIQNISKFEEGGGDVLYITALDRENLLDVLKPYSIEASENKSSFESAQSHSTGHLHNQTGFFYCEEGLPTFIADKQIQHKLKHQGKVGLKFDGFEEVSTSRSTPETFILKPFNEESKFNIEEYLSNLKTRFLGRHVINLQSVSSSMNVISGPLMCDGLVVIPDQQTAGEGRGGNRWISPEGCAMFSLQIHLDPGAGIGKTPSLIQHIVGLAVVQALGKYIQLRLKWPNDIYFQDQVKLGGVVVNSSMSANNFIINIGCGLNLDNALPTISVNQLIDNQEPPSSRVSTKISREEYLASVLNNLEILLDKFIHGQSCDVIQAYHQVWLHSEQQVTILKQKKTNSNPKEEEVNLEVNQEANHEVKQDINHEANEEVEVKIVGIDEYGYLIVKDRTGLQFSVHDDGNSFDMMNGLIRPKY